MRTYVAEVRWLLSQLTPECHVWQYTDQQVLELFEVLIVYWHTHTDAETRLKRKILYVSKAWRLREMDIILPICVTAGVNPWLREFVLGRHFTSLRRQMNFQRWFPTQDSFWDDDSLEIDDE